VLKTALSSRGYAIRTAADGDEAVQMMREWPPDLLITDLRMPNMDGLALCKHVRSRSQLPIIVLSVKGEEQTKVQALDAGADDYVTKPFNMNELLARVRAAIRRATMSPKLESDTIEAGDFHIDQQAREVKVRGREVRLTPKEYDVLVYLAKHPAKVITHRVLLAAVWGDTSTDQPEYLRVVIAHLRKKLGEDEKAPRYIITEPWVGYRFNPGEE